VARSSTGSPFNQGYFDVTHGGGPGTDFLETSEPFFRRYWRFLGFAYARSDTPVVWAGVGGRLAESFFRIPYWFCCAFTAALPAHHVRRRLMRARQPHACPGCGYDLRATPIRCPECGEAPVPFSSNLRE
jgi:hypothetical protein